MIRFRQGVVVFLLLLSCVSVGSQLLQVQLLADGSSEPRGSLELQISTSDCSTGIVSLSGVVTGLTEPCLNCSIGFYQSYSCDSDLFEIPERDANGVDIWAKYAQDFTVEDTPVNITALGHPDVCSFMGRAVALRSNSEIKACGQLLPYLNTESATATIGAIGTSEDVLAVLNAGSVTVSPGADDDLLLQFDWSLSDLPASSSGVIVHSSGEICESASNVTVLAPWSSDSLGSSLGDTQVPESRFGVTSIGELSGTISLLDDANSTLSCGVLHRPRPLTGFVVAIAQSSGLSFLGSFLNPSSIAQGSWHVHSGATCDAPGAHYKDDVLSDLWSSTNYSVSVAEDQISYIGLISHQVSPDYNLAFAELENKTLVIHAPNGDKIGCGVLQKSILDDTSGSTLSPTQSPPQSNVSVSIAPTAVPTSQTTMSPSRAQTASPTKTQSASPTRAQTASPSKAPSVPPTITSSAPTIAEIVPSSTDRSFVILTLALTAIVVCCTCGRGMRKRNSESYKNVGEYGDFGGIEMGDSQKDLLSPIETRSSRDLDLI